MNNLQTFSGGSHCGAIRFEVQLPSEIEVQECNCSICRKSGYLHVIVAAARFHLRRGADELQQYSFNSGVAHHYFCRTYGIKSYYVPRSNPDGYSINLRCLDGVACLAVKIVPFDGLNWEQNAASLRHLGV